MPQRFVDIETGQPFTGEIPDPVYALIGDTGTRVVAASPGDEHYEPTLQYWMLMQGFIAEEERRKGGAGSGNFGHAGRPGKVGGSAAGSGHGRAGGGIQETNRKKIGTQELSASYYTAYRSGAEARKALLGATQPFQDRIGELDVQIRDCTKRIAVLRRRYAELRKLPYEGDVLDEIRSIDNQMWSIRWQEQHRLSKERKKVVAQQNATVKAWMEGMGAENPGRATVTSPDLAFFNKYWKAREGGKLTDEQVLKNIQLDPSDYEDARQLSRMQTALDRISTVIEGRVAEKMEVNCGASPFSGAFYHGKTNTIYVVPTFDTNYMMGATCHEFGHWLEHNIPGVDQRMAAFIKRRTAGEPLKQLSKKATEAHVLVRKDKFIDPYVGRDYGDGGTEALSVGLEMLFTDPLRLARRDAEHFDLVVSVLRGIPEK